MKFFVGSGGFGVEPSGDAAEVVDDGGGHVEGECLTNGAPLEASGLLAVGPWPTCADGCDVVLLAANTL